MSLLVNKDEVEKRKRAKRIAMKGVYNKELWLSEENEKRILTIQEERRKYKKLYTLFKSFFPKISRDDMVFVMQNSNMVMKAIITDLETVFVERVDFKRHHIQLDRNNPLKNSGGW